jgi:hypothetical protein
MVPVAAMVRLTPVVRPAATVWVAAMVPLAVMVPLEALARLAPTLGPATADWRRHLLTRARSAVGSPGRGDSTAAARSATP